MRASGTCSVADAVLAIDGEAVDDEDVEREHAQRPEGLGLDNPAITIPNFRAQDSPRKMLKAARIVTPPTMIMIQPHVVDPLKT